MVGTYIHIIQMLKTPGSREFSGDSENIWRTPDSISGYTAGHLSVTRAYEPRRDLVTAVSNRFNSAVISAFNYVNDAAGRRVSRADSGPAFAQSQSNAFAYNARSEITGAAMHTNAYGYVVDSLGNRLASAVNGAETGYTANHLNQYTAINSATYTAAPQYDADGNLIALGDRTFVYDAENRMTGVSSNGIPAASYTYDHHSRRIRKTTPAATHDFIYDEWSLLRETILSNGVSSTVDYFWGNDLSETLQGAGGVGGLIAASIGGQFYFALYDNNGNITEYVDEFGAVVASYAYDAFGNTISQSGPMADVFRFRFSTKYHDPETGLYYYGRRFYDPPLGRWLNRDPIGERGGLNLYGFVENDPMAKWDKLGQAPGWNYSVKPHVDENGERFEDGVSVIVSYKLSDEEKKCCNSVLVHRWMKTPLGGIFGPATWGAFKYDQTPGTFFPGSDVAHAADDNPRGPMLFVYRLRWTMTFKFEAECVGGAYAGKTLSSVEKKYRVEGHFWFNGDFKGWFLDSQQTASTRRR